MRKILFLLVLLPGFFLSNITIPAIFSDNMVLKRNSEITIWGNANVDEEIILTADFLPQTLKTKADRLAKWKITFRTPKEGGPYTLSLKGFNEILLKNILIGEVFLCSGQSNMEMTANWGIDNAQQEMKNASDDGIRMFTVARESDPFPQNNFYGSWFPSTPDGMKYFSSVAFFFAQKLRSELKNVPIGIIQSAWGGTPAEIWMPAEKIEQDPLLLRNSQLLTKTTYGPIEPGRAYNAMIHPMQGFNLSGFLWYQGEQNIENADLYSNTLMALIESWREGWKDSTIPFYLVQIAPYKYDTDGGVKIRNAQQKVASEAKNTYLVVTSDISTIDDIHPRNKKSVGVRLANLALKYQFHQPLGIVESPQWERVSFSDANAVLHLKYAQGLHFKANGSKQFEIAGEDSKFYPASAQISGTSIIVTSKKVRNPQKVRFAWGSAVQADLFNKAGLPASSFSSDSL